MFCSGQSRTWGQSLPTWYVLSSDVVKDHAHGLVQARAPSDITAWEPSTDAVWVRLCDRLWIEADNTPLQFKIDELGKTSDGKWAATDILSENNSIYTFTIPASLKAGQYIIRHEM